MNQKWRVVDRALVALLAIMFILFGLAYIGSRHTDQRLHEIDRVSCQNRLLILRWHVHHATGVDAATGVPWKRLFMDELERTRNRCS